MDIDQASENFSKNLVIWENSLANIETEQDTRFQIINLFLVEILGWDHSEIKTEKKSETGYVDYLMKHGDRNFLVVEAKRSGAELISTQNNQTSPYKIGGPALKAASEGLHQARKYCIDHSVQFAGLTNGIQWIGFLGMRTDGRPFTEGKCIVFPNLKAIESTFATFYDLFSKEGVLKHRFLIHINKAEGVVVQATEKLIPSVTEKEIFKVGRTSFSAELAQVFNEFFSEMSGENDPEMIMHCFVESRESHEADVALQKIARRLVNTIGMVNTEAGDELRRHIEDAVERQRGEFVLIVGNKGAGKSTFIDRFFRFILTRTDREKCLFIKIDIGDSPGDQNTITHWITSRLITEIEACLFDDGIPDFNELKGIFFRDYQRWQKGEFSPLFKSNITEFEIEFGKYIANIKKENPYEYVLKLLGHCVTSRRHMPCLVFDNTDHFPQKFQDAVFQYAQSIHRQIFSFVICPITDRSIWQLSKQGPLQSYITYVFYLPSPSPKEVLQKRISFVRGKIEGSQQANNYFLEKGIRVSIKDLKAFAAALEEIFVNTDYVGRLIGGLSNFDIRRSLRLSHRIICSPIISLDRLVSTYINGDKPHLRRDHIYLALIKGDYTFFHQQESDLLLNVFSVKSDNITSPLAKLSLLRVLIDKDNLENETENKYLSIEDLQKYFLPTGLSANVIFPLIQELLTFGLIETYDPSSQLLAEEQRVRITISGKTHMELALQDGTFISQMACITALRKEEIARRLKTFLFETAKSNWKDIKSLFISYCLEEDGIFMSIPDDVQYKNQNLFRSELRRKWTRPISPSLSI